MTHSVICPGLGVHEYLLDVAEIDAPGRRDAPIDWPETKALIVVGPPQMTIQGPQRHYNQRDHHHCSHHHHHHHHQSSSSSVIAAPIHPHPYHPAGVLGADEGVG